jgi:hypothetical protein
MSDGGVSCQAYHSYLFLGAKCCENLPLKGGRKGASVLRLPRQQALPHSERTAGQEISLGGDTTQSPSLRRYSLYSGSRTRPRPVRKFSVEVPIRGRGGAGVEAEVDFDEHIMRVLTPKRRQKKKSQLSMKPWGKPKRKVS